MGQRDTYAKVLVQACMVAGDESALAEKLGVSTVDVVDWLLGDRPRPVEVFLLAVDVILADTRERVREHRRQIEETRALLEAIRRRHRASV